MPSQFEVIELPGRFAVCWLAGDAPIPPWATAAEFFSITRTAYQFASTPLPSGRGAGGEGTSRAPRVFSPYL